MTVFTAPKRWTSLILIGCVLGALPTATFAQDADELFDLCTDSDAQTEERINACNLAIPALSGDALADASYNLGRALRAAERYEESLTAFNAALDVRPEDALTYRSRSVSFRQLERWPEALSDLNESLRLDPENEWAHYWRGHVHFELDDLEASLADFEIAARLDHDDYINLFWLGRAQERLGLLEDAADTFTLAQAEEPFLFNPFSARGDVHEQRGDVDAAVQDFRTAVLLDPNQRRLESRVTGLIGEIEAPLSLPPYQFDPSDLPQDVTSLMVLLPMDTREDIEIAIGALANWFAPARLETPQAAAWSQERFEIGDTGDVVSTIMITDRFDVPDAVPNDIVRHSDRGVVVTLNRAGTAGPGMIMLPNDPSVVDALWPLEVGKMVTGSGTYRALCPPERNLAGILMGCGSEGSVDAGTYTFETEVTGIERIGVPAGTFDTFIVRHREQGTVSQLGRDQERSLETVWWVAPDAGTWVRRTSVQGDQIAIMERVSITYE